MSRRSSEPDEPATARQAHVFDRQAPAYTRRRRRTDLGQGAEARWRRRLLESASGRVLEVGVGAGANFAFYSAGVAVTAVDLSRAMLAAAEQAARQHGVAATFVHGDIAASHFPDGHFDAIVSTLALCSWPDPLTTLQRLRSWLKPGGTLLALEHGLSVVPPLNLLLYAADPVQHALLGCHAARRPLALIRAAGFRVVRSERHYAGLISLVWAMP